MIKDEQDKLGVIKMSEDTQDKKSLEMAEQQFTGFNIGKTSGDIEELVSSMGLTFEEWEIIKSGELSCLIDELDSEIVDSYFSAMQLENR